MMYNYHFCHANLRWPPLTKDIVNLCKDLTFQMIMNDTSAQYTIASKCRLIVKLSCPVQLTRLCKAARGHAKSNELESDHRVDQ